MKTPRRRAREFTVQTLYLSLIQPTENALSNVETIQHSEAYLKASEGSKKPKVDENLYLKLSYGSLKECNHCKELLIPFLDRDEKDINPIEMAILLMACYELDTMPETPHQVIINEAVEISKTYGGTDGYKFVNAVLDGLVKKLRLTDQQRH